MASEKQARYVRVYERAIQLGCAEPGGVLLHDPKTKSTYQLYSPDSEDVAAVLADECSEDYLRSIERALKLTADGAAGAWIEWSDLKGMRPFSKDDWYGFAGAEDFADGRSPRIGEMMFNGRGCLAILDRTGLTVIEEEGGEAFAVTSTTAEVAALGMPVVVDASGNAVNPSFARGER